MQVITAPALPSPARAADPVRDPLRIGVVQHRWREDADALADALAQGVRLAAESGARLVVLPELTLSRYPAFQQPPGAPDETAEDLDTGPTATWAASVAREHGVLVHASLFERGDPDRTGDGRGFNTGILVGSDGTLVARTRKLHIPVTEGYCEDQYFRPGPATSPYPVHPLPGLDAGFGMPTCWDQWFPEVARAYGLAGADVVAYPTAIGSEPDHPDFDTSGPWKAVMTGHAVANGLFVVAANRTGDEGRIRFYGSSFVVDPYGRTLVQAPRDEEAVLVADVDLDQRRDWLELFPFFGCRRPDTYASLTAAVDRSPAPGARG